MGGSECAVMTTLLPVRVLVLDDDDAVCRRLSGWLHEADYDVATFGAPAEAANYLQKVSVHVALVDMTMPDISGVELLAQLREVAPRTQLIALAAFPEIQPTLAAFRAGARDLLEKPIQQPALLDAVRRQLAELGMVARSEEEFNRRLGARVRTARAACNMTLSEVASVCGISAAQLSHIELGKTGTSAWMLGRICAALKLRPFQLLESL